MPSQPAAQEPSHLKLVVVENDRRERYLTLEGACQHDGEIAVHVSGGNTLSDHAVSYGVCKSCKAWVCRTEWYTSDVNDTRLLTPKELDMVQRIEDRYRRLDQ